MTTIAPIGPAGGLPLPAPRQTPAPPRPAVEDRRPGPATFVPPPPRGRTGPAPVAGATWSGRLAVERYREIATLPEEDGTVWLGRLDTRV